MCYTLTRVVTFISVYNNRNGLSAGILTFPPDFLIKIIKCLMFYKFKFKFDVNNIVGTYLASIFTLYVIMGILGIYTLYDREICRNPQESKAGTEFVTF